MNDLHRTARITGILYLVMSALMVFGYLYVPARFLASDSAAETARAIASGATMYRLSILFSLLAQMLFVFVVLNLYEIFQDTDRKLARLMTTLVCIGVAAELVNVANRMMPLSLANGGESLSGLTRAQLEALAMASFRSSGNVGRVLTAIWGLWLLPFGRLTIKSGYFPRVLGWALLAAGGAYMVTCAVSIAAPSQLPWVSRVVTPLYFGELPIVFWLALFGARTRQGAASSSALREARPLATQE
ncbi:MAG TPA: DUF4386 domain-containing protein [Candidatus Eisenbacteria bacterium]|nr:DUF4386 domain-containing protein [Candidatus Eisenbacteria bacterium]